MNTKMITYLALGGLAGYAISRALSKHPVVEAAEATEKAADAAVKAADAATQTAAVAGALASQGNNGYGMGRRIQPPVDFWDASRVLGIKKALAKDNALSEDTIAFLKEISVNGKAVHYDADTPSKVYLTNASKKAGRDVYRTAPFSVYVGKKNTPESQSAFLTHVAAEAARVGGEGMTDLRSSYSQAEYDAWAEPYFGYAPTSPYQRFQEKAQAARAKARARRAANPTNLAD
jgi:hypothetical protein